MSIWLRGLYFMVKCSIDCIIVTILILLICQCVSVIEEIDRSSVETGRSF